MLLFPIGYPAIYAIGPFWCLIAFGISCIVEIGYLYRFADPFAWGWVVGGNVLSNIVLMALPPVALLIKQTHYQLAQSLEPHEVWMNPRANWELGAVPGQFCVACSPRRGPKAPYDRR